jgi:hypothetical protein
MLVGYMRVSSDSDRQSTDLQRDALLAINPEDVSKAASFKLNTGVCKDPVTPEFCFTPKR